MTERYSPDEQQTLEIEGASGVEGSGKSSGPSPSAPGSKARDHVLIRFLSSLILAIVLFLTLAVLTIFGTFIEQGRDPAFYLASYGPKWGPWILNLKIDNIYHSWYYTSLLALLCVKKPSAVPALGM